MKIIWHGHSCFTVESSAGTVVLDPYEDGSVPGYPPLHLTADRVLCSHEHRDHGAKQVVRLTGNKDSYLVETIDTFHDDARGSKRGSNRIHILSAEGLRIAHLGDLGCALTAEEQKMLQGLDAVMIPVGGFFTINAAEAAQIVSQFSARVVIPMHYRDGQYGYEVIGELEPFLALCDEVVRYEAGELTLTAQTPRQTAVLSFVDRG